MFTNIGGEGKVDKPQAVMPETMQCNYCVPQETCLCNVKLARDICSISEAVQHFSASGRPCEGYYISGAVQSL